jgi:plasmid maintenance system antidote protein VapI
VTAGDLTRRMKTAGIGDAALARALGVTPVAVWYWRQGQRAISKPMALLLAAYFDGKLDLKPRPSGAGRKEKR